jgi:phosphoribosyl 1,2-cyclic phosphate phosphodiesterase
MNLLFLGTGTSTGVPQIGCNCRTCTSTDPRDERLRASVLFTIGDKHILIDCGPDFRQQMIRYKVTDLTAILLTHEHYDHVSGLDDVRPMGNAQIYAEKKVLNTILRNMPYCFSENRYPGVPRIQLHEIDDNNFEIEGIKVQPIRVMHARLPILGFRIGNIAYLTDVKTIELKAIEQLQNLDVLVINALRHKEHIAHLTLEEALETARRINARKTYFTHFSHDIGLHEEISNILPKNVYLAYDGLSLQL